MATWTPEPGITLNKSGGVFGSRSVTIVKKRPDGTTMSSEDARSLSDKYMGQITPSVAERAGAIAAVMTAGTEAARVVGTEISGTPPGSSASVPMQNYPGADFTGNTIAKNGILGKQVPGPMGVVSVAASQSEAAREETAKVDTSRVILALVLVVLFVRWSR